MPISAVPSQPSSLSQRGRASVFLVRPLETTTIIASMIGTATTPLITAVQNSMAMGLMLVAASAPPPSVAAPMMA